MHTGLYFGSFNPIHNGHLIIATHLLNTTHLNQIWFIVSPQNPLKKSGSLLNEYHRFHLIQLAIEGEKNLRVSNVEFSLPKPSYTIDTLTYLAEKHPDRTFTVIMGSDSYTNIHKWKNNTKLLDIYPIFIYQRPGFPVEKLSGKSVKIAAAPLLEISSTRVRELIAEGKSFRYLVPDIVKEEIERNGYYRKKSN